ncbi:peptidase A2 [Gloeothece verrucosa]|uniref:Peptidase A2A, retrovirus RVP subgroup n=1 Tax=Gloeothece verrucosa (strain PCC 7822) TaxID=497965 RepID=E0UG51_GLOV7|nr:peptidase A2 [Gloeothece verrucosa]ADN15552.1 Peptidase A2A, retrovirus RVP subgroup [Gloeothece verrucosa PCC 7822]
MEIYPYQYNQLTQQYLPIIEIKIRNLKNPDFEIKDLGILDTGSDITLIPFSVLSRLNTLTAKRKPIEFYGVGNKKTIGIAYRLAVSLDTGNFFKTIVYGCAEDDTQGIMIIGRNILNRFSITFDGINKQIIIND